MNKKKQAEQKHHISGVIYHPLFPRPICLEKCTMNMPNGYEKDILMTLSHSAMKPHIIGKVRIN
jgi:hypothetical protein